MNEYPADIVNVRVSIRSVVVNKIFSNTDPILAIFQDCFYVTARDSNLILQFPCVTENEDNEEEPEAVIEVDSQIDQLVSLEKQLCYVSKNVIYDLKSNKVFFANELCLFQEYLVFERQIIIGICELDDKYCFLSNKLESTFIDLPKFEECIIGMFNCYPVLLTMHECSVRIYKIENDLTITEITSLETNMTVVGMLNDELLLKNDQLLRKMDILSKETSDYETAVFAVEVIPLMPKKKQQEFIILNNEDILFKNDKFEDVITVTNYVKPNTMNIAQVMDEFVADRVEILYNGASSFELPQFEAPFEPLNVNIEGCDNKNAEFIKRNNFGKLDYCYIIATTQFEKPLVALHYLSFADIYRNDSQNIMYKFESNEERAQEWCKCYKDRENDAFAGFAAKQEPEPAEQKSAIPVSLPQLPLEELNNDEENDTENERPPVSFSHSDSPKEQKTYDFQLVTEEHNFPSNEKTEASYKIQDNPLEAFEEFTNVKEQGSAANEQKVSCESPALNNAMIEVETTDAEVQTSEEKILEPLNINISADEEEPVLASEFDEEGVYFNAFEELCNRLQKVEVSIKYEYDEQFKIDIYKEKDEKYLLQLFSGTLPYIEEANYRLFCKKRELMNNSCYQEYKLIKQELLSINESNYLSQQNLQINNLNEEHHGQLVRSVSLEGHQEFVESKAFKKQFSKLQDRLK